MTNERPTGSAGEETGAPMRRMPRPRLSAGDQRRIQENVREVSFPIALRGYDRAAVDRYVQEVNRLIAELELSSSPEAAVRHALDEVSEETSGLLQRAYETAEEITARSRAKADDRIQEAEREAKSLREGAAREVSELRNTAQRQAEELRVSVKREVEQLRAVTEARVQELERNADTVWRERRRLLDEMRAVAQEQLEIAEAAMARFPQAGLGAEEPTQAIDPDSAPQAEAEAEQQG